MASVRPTGARIRSLSLAARDSARNDYADIVTVSGDDEIGSLGALFNDTAADIRRKSAESRDREEVLRRYVENTTADVGEPLVDLERHLSQVMAARPDRDIEAAVKAAHRLATRLQNQAAVIRLRGSLGSDAARAGGSRRGRRHGRRQPAGAGRVREHHD